MQNQTTFKINLFQDPTKQDAAWEWEVRNLKTDELLIWGESFGKEAAREGAERAARRAAQADSYLYRVNADGSGARVNEDPPKLKPRNPDA